MAQSFEDLLENLDKLSPEQYEQLQAWLDKKRKSGTIDKDDGNAFDEKQPCVHCGSINTKKHGKISGRQRFICKDCGKTFNTSTGAITSNSRLTTAQWKELIRGVVENLPIGEIAKNVGIARSSAWINKQKICYALMVLYGKQDNFVDIAECDEYYVPVSFKGKRDPDFFINTLNRMPRHHMTYEEKIEWLMKNDFWDELQNDPERLAYLLNSGDGYLRGISRDQTCILTCQDRSGNLFMTPTCVSRPETEDIKKELQGRFASDSIFVTDSHNAYPSFAASEHIQHEQIESGKHANGPFNLGRINALHSDISSYWSKSAERAPATKYMDLSLILLWWLRKSKELTIHEKVDKLYEIVQDQHITVDALYEDIKNRELKINTKGYFPKKV